MDSKSESSMQLVFEFPIPWFKAWQSGPLFTRMGEWNTCRMVRQLTGFLSIVRCLSRYTSPLDAPSRLQAESDANWEEAWLWSLPLVHTSHRYQGKLPSSWIHDFILPFWVKLIYFGRNFWQIFFHSTTSVMQWSQISHSHSDPWICHVILATMLG